MRSLRRAEHSRRLLLLRALVDQLVKRPQLALPLPPPEDAWNLLERAQFAAAAEVDTVLDHPYTGAWLSYTMRLLRSGVTGVSPLWVHIGYLHCLAAAAAVRAGIAFQTAIPVWHGGAILPTLGLIRVPTTETYATVAVRGGAGVVEADFDTTRIRLPPDLSADTTDWWPVRRLAASASGHDLLVRFDDVDPYRGSYEPIVHQRTTGPEIASWRRLLPRAWASLADCLPDFADAMSVGLNVLGPLPVMAHRPSSESNGEAFGSAMIGLPDLPHELAAMLVHEFQHIRQVRGAPAPEPDEIADWLGEVVA
jgi:HEXXH motif-containing protein